MQDRLKFLESEAAKSLPELREIVQEIWDDYPTDAENGFYDNNPSRVVADHVQDILAEVYRRSLR